MGLDVGIVKSDTTFEANSRILSDSGIDSNTPLYTGQVRVEGKIRGNEITVTPILEHAKQFQ